MSRRSVRKYSDKTIDDTLLQNCIKNALYGTPTVCNRPINKVYIIKNLDMKKLLSYQNGNGHFWNKCTCYFNYYIMFTKFSR